MSDTKNAYISNDDLFKKAPELHEFAIERFEGQVTESNYHDLQGWQVTRDEDGTLQGIVKPVFPGDEYYVNK